MEENLKNELQILNDKKTEIIRIMRKKTWKLITDYIIEWVYDNYEDESFYETMIDIVECINHIHFKSGIIIAKSYDSISIGEYQNINVPYGKIMISFNYNLYDVISFLKVLQEYDIDDDDGMAGLISVLYEDYLELYDKWGVCNASML